jgi:Transport and Golgi organisation 2
VPSLCAVERGTGPLLLRSAGALERASVAKVCTAVTRWTPGEPLHILAIRDEFTSREFDDPAAWWPKHPNVIGGRDRQAGGSWCVSDIAAGTTALVLNGTERRTGTPSRGILPFAAIEAGDRWPQQLEYREMASFILVLATPSGVTTWTWNARELRRSVLSPGTHVYTSHGVDASDAKTARLANQLAQQSWLDVVTAVPPTDDRTALIVRHELENGTYATVIGQFIDNKPGHLQVRYSRTPWNAASWTTRSWP